VSSDCILVLVVGFTEHLQLVTKSIDNELTVLHTLQIAVGHIMSSQSAVSSPLSSVYVLTGWNISLLLLN
jgi:hypothetical protein